MTWLKSRRLQYLLAITALFFSLMVVLRAVFYFGFSPLSGDSDIATDTILTAWGIGLRFDLRLALLLMLPLAALAYLPWLNLLRSSIARFVGHAYLLLALLLVVLTYILDFGHYAYLGDRLNVTALRFLEDTAISTQMVWESYPVIWITLGWLPCGLRKPCSAVRKPALPKARPHSAFSSVSHCSSLRSWVGSATSIFLTRSRCAGAKPSPPVTRR